MNQTLPECVGDIPNICGREDLILEALARTDPRPSSDSRIDFARIHSAFAIALHMHQPLIPAGGDDLRTAKIISNLRYMLEHPNVADHHNAPVFRWCYKRMGEFIPQLVRAGRQPRVMLDYSGCLLYGLREMGADDVLESLRAITSDPIYQPCVEWLGSAWGYLVDHCRSADRAQPPPTTATTTSGFGVPGGLFRPVKWAGPTRRRSRSTTAVAT